MKGSTLVEMLVALFIFSLLAAAGVGALRFTADNQAVVAAHAARLAAFQRTRAILKSDLAQGAERWTRDEAGRPVREAFYGGNPGTGVELLRFVRRGWDNPDAEARPSLQYVEYRLTEGRLERRARMGLDGGTLSAPQVLLEGVHVATVSFLWGDQWIGTLPGGPIDPLPQAVRLDLDIEGFGPVSQLFLVTGDAG